MEIMNWKVCPEEQKQLLSSAQSSSYLDTYVKLMEELSSISIANEWLYRLVGWYNMQPYLTHLIDRMLNCQGKKRELEMLVNTIDSMTVFSPTDETMTGSPTDKLIAGERLKE